MGAVVSRFDVCVAAGTVVWQPVESSSGRHPALAARKRRPSHHPTREALDAVIASGSTGGFGKSFQQLNAVLVA